MYICTYIKNLLNPQIPTHYPLIYSLSWLYKSVERCHRVCEISQHYKLHERQHNSHMNTLLAFLYASNAQCQHESGRGRAKVKVCCMYACMWCLRLCLIISVVTLKMHKCCLNAIQEMQGAKIEMLLPCHVLQLLCPSPINVGVLRAWRWAQGTQFVSCMCLALR